MSNIKDVHIEGWMSFDASTIGAGEDFRSGQQDEKVMQMLAILNLPTVGIRIAYLQDSIRIENEHGGTTTFEHFIITGQEAFSSLAFEEWVKALMRVGVVVKAIYCDLENQTPYFNIPIPGPLDSKVARNLVEVAAKRFAGQELRRREARQRKGR